MVDLRRFVPTDNELVRLLEVRQVPVGVGEEAGLIVISQQGRHGGFWSKDTIRGQGRGFEGCKILGPHAESR